MASRAEKEFPSGCIETFTGECFDLANPKPEQVHIKDIAYALARICRYTGHCRRFYSVAAHSVWCADYAKTLGRPRQQQFAVLMHDATEAYIGDINRPLKLMLGDKIKDIESRIAWAIKTRFGLSSVDYHVEDSTALATEARVLMPSKGRGWNLQYPPFGYLAMSQPQHDEKEFMRFFNRFSQKQFAETIGMEAGNVC